MRVDPEKLLSATLASHTFKLDYNAIARIYGEGATYNSVEHKFRKYRKDAEKLRAEAAEGDTSPNFRPQPAPGRTPRARPQSSKSSTVTPGSRKRANTSKATSKSKTPIPIQDDTEDEMSPVKPEIKLDNQATRDLLGIVEVKDDSDESDSPPPVKKRKRLSLFSTSAAEDLCSLSAFRDEAAAFHQNSQENGYAVNTINLTDVNFTNDDDIEVDLEATQSGKPGRDDEYGDFDEI